MTMSSTNPYILIIFITIWYVSINHREDQGDFKYEEYSRFDFNYESLFP